MNSPDLINVSIVTYISFTFLFFVMKFNFMPANKFMLIFVFLLITCVVQLIQNISISASPELCGTADFQMAFKATVIPWVLVFTVFVLFMISSPGWLRVFSNTFGVFAAEAYGIQSHIQAVIAKPLGTPEDYESRKMLEQIYSDRMSLVVELNLDDVIDTKDKFVFPALNELERLKLIEPMPTDPTKIETMLKARKALYKALLLKDNVGLFIWFLLIGIFCILVSTNTLLSSSCSPKVGKSYNSIFNS